MKSEIDMTFGYIDWRDDGPDIVGGWSFDENTHRK